jgi:hypothetical protein
MSARLVEDLVQTAKDKGLFQSPGAHKSQVVWLLELSSDELFRPKVVQCLQWMQTQRLEKSGGVIDGISSCAGFVSGVDWRPERNAIGLPVQEHEKGWLKDIETAQKTKPYEFVPAVTGPVKPDRRPWDGYVEQMTFTEVSAGIGFFAAAFEAAGMKCAVLIEPVDRALQLAVRNCSVDEAVPVGLFDVDPSEAEWTHGLVGGPECQPFSSAGRQRAWEDPRSYTMLRTLHLMAVMKPWWVWLENVSAIETVQDGGVWEVIQEIAHLAGYEVKMTQV